MSSAGAAGGLTQRLAADLAALDLELAEIDLLISQATAEAERHEQKRAAAADRLQGAQNIGEPAASLAEQAMALVTLSRRAGVMAAQVDVLQGKRKSLARYRDALAIYLGLPIEGEPAAGAEAGSSEAERAGPAARATRAGQDRAAARVALAAQEELRREIARAMHDGPAQSLSNIVLQAQIVERIAERDPAAAREEVRQLMAMVQRTLEATKSFISDVRPMVLDDLGLVPTLRGAARDRGRRAGVNVGFDSFGPDRRLPTDIESALFRLIDDVLAAYVSLAPDDVQLRLDWSEEQLEIRLAATRSARTAAPALPPGSVPPSSGPTSADLPPALVAMIAQRRDDEAAAAETARLARIAALPDEAWREVQFRVAGLGLDARLEDGGATLTILADLAAFGAR